MTDRADPGRKPMCDRPFHPVGDLQPDRLERLPSDGISAGVSALGKFAWNVRTNFNGQFGQYDAAEGTKRDMMEVVDPAP
jgi:hypothetical protein